MSAYQWSPQNSAQISIKNHGSLEIQGDWYEESKLRLYIIWQDKQEKQENGINTMTVKRLLKKEC